MPTSIIIKHPPSPPPPLFLKHPRCLSKVLSTQHSTGCLLNATRKPCCYRENFISIKQLHGNSSRAQGTPAARLPTCLSLFLGTSEWRGYPVSHLSERTQPTSEKSSRVSISLNQLIGSQTPQLHSSTAPHPDLKLKSLLHLLKCGSKQQAVGSILKSANSILSDWVWSDGHYNRLTSILITTGQKKDKSNL